MFLALCDIACLLYRLLPSKTFILQAIYKEKHIFLKPRCWNGYETYDVAIVCAGNQFVNLKEKLEKKLLFRFSLFYLVSLTFGIYGTLLLPFMLLTKPAKKKTLFVGILRVELQSLQSSGLPSRVRKLRSSKVEILTCV